MSFLVRGVVGLFLLSLHAPLVSSRIQARDGSGPGIPFQKTSGVGLTDLDIGDAAYFVNITLGGQQFSVQLDTGSSDLWVFAPNANLKISNDSHLSANITYGSGSVEGPIQFAELKVGEYTIPSQAFINVAKLGEGTPPDLLGILGVGFDSDNASEVDKAVHKAWGESNTLGRTFLSNLLAQNSSMQPSYDIALGRAIDLENGDDDTPGGSFVIGYHDPAYAAIAQAPQIPRVVDGRWAGSLDGMSVNGQSVSFPPSQIANTSPGKLVALFDSGTSNLIVPGPLADAIFEQVEGSIKVNSTWYVPCYSGVNVTFSIGGQDFAVHPLDLNRAQPLTSTLRDGTETTFTLCESSFQDASDFGKLPGFDLVLGDVFLKNVISSYNFGSMNRESDHSGASGSFLQLLSITNADDAWVDFQTTRSVLLSTLFPAVIDPIFLPTLFPWDFGSVENTTESGLITPFPSGAPSTSATATPSSTSAAASTKSPAAAAAALADIETSSPTDSGSDSSVVSLLDKYGPVVIGLLGANVAVMLLLCIIALAACARGAVRSGARTRSAPTYVPVSFREKPSGAYDDPEENAPVRGYSDQ